ncbi:SDR family NAD(P)-dependent oxidoreductase [Plantactinospora sp. GCM10030261]|uniref:SDR family NAD(P)-dependent oxidoreductase n=1 Tax=Plantactinospora sp. GCM10030261 TaxID=3273420 RepID=UPI00361D710D
MFSALNHIGQERDVNHVDNEVVIVTGGGKGIGRAYALALAQAGYRVAVADIADPSVVVTEINDNGGQAMAVHVDVAVAESTGHMARTVVDRWGQIDGLINNAAYFTTVRKKPFDELTVDEWDIAFQVNVRGTWLCCKSVFPYMRDRGYGKIVNTSSMVVPTAVPYFLHYVSTKSAIIGLTRALAREVGRHGIAVNTLSPCYVPHDPTYVAKQDDAMGTAIVQERIFKREMRPDDLIGTMLYLIGHGSDFVTGQNLYVNGGRAFT